jgi:hypothetical protein
LIAHMAHEIEILLHGMCLAAPSDSAKQNGGTPEGTAASKF